MLLIVLTAAAVDAASALTATNTLAKKLVILAELPVSATATSITAPPLPKAAKGAWANVA
jgi:hypothetical protein